MYLAALAIMLGLRLALLLGPVTECLAVGVVVAAVGGGAPPGLRQPHLLLLMPIAKGFLLLWGPVNLRG